MFQRQQPGLNACALGGIQRTDGLPNLFERQHLGLVRDRVAQGSNAIGFDLDHIAGFQPDRRIAARPRRSAFR
jgi:hypothetical protein